MRRARRANPDNVGRSGGHPYWQPARVQDVCAICQVRPEPKPGALCQRCTDLFVVRTPEVQR